MTNSPTPVRRAWIPTMVLGIVIFALGLFIGVRLLIVHTPLTGTRWLDVAFAIVFMLRGMINVKRAQARRG